ncbi:MAG: ABC transporter substrate-binding protein [Candidatus Saccharibacteria bacterium]
MRKLYKVFALFLCVALLLTPVVGCGSKANDANSGAASATIKVGFLGALTGDVANYGIPGLKGLKLAAEELNAKGGILGKKVEIIEEDNRGDTTEAANITKKFISRDKVNVIIGDPCTGITKVAAKIAQDNKMVLISAGATGKGVVEAGEFVFRDTLLDSVAAPAVVDYLIKKNMKNFAVVTAKNDEYSVGLSEIFRSAITSKGGKIVSDESIQKGDKNFAAQVTAIKPTKPDIIVFTGYYTEAALFMKEVRKQGMKQVFVGGDGCLGPDLYTNGGTAVEGSIVYCGFSPEQPTAETKKFLDAYKKKYGEEGEMFSSQYYDALMIIAAAMEKAKSADPKVYRAELAKTASFPGASGVITFTASREPVKSPVYLLTVKNNSFKLLDKVPVTAK